MCFKNLNYKIYEKELKNIVILHINILLYFIFSSLEMNHFDLIGNYLLDLNLVQILQIFSPHLLYHQHKKYIIKVFLLTIFLCFIYLLEVTIYFILFTLKLAAYGRRRYRYAGKHSEGNRFILNRDL